MKSTAVVPAPAPGVEALIKEARRRQRRRYATTGVAAAAVLAAALGALAGLHGAGVPGRASQPRPRPAAGHSAGPYAPGIDTLRNGLVPGVTSPLRVMSGGVSAIHSAKSYNS